MWTHRFDKAARGGKTREEIDLSTTVTVGDGLAFRTSSAIDRLHRTQFFHVANYNPTTGTYERRRVDYPLTRDEVKVLRAHGIAEVDAATGVEPGKAKIDNRFVRRVAGSGGTGFRAMVEALLLEDDDSRDLYGQVIPLPEELRQKEREILGAFHIRTYLIEEGLIASSPNKITGRCNIFTLAELQRNAFDPRIVTQIHAEEWQYAGQRANGLIQPKPIFVHGPYEDVTLNALDSFLERKPVIPGKADRQDMVRALQKMHEDEAAKVSVLPTLTKKEQEFIFEALLTEKGSVSSAAQRWLAKLEEIGHPLKLSDLADENGPLGTLFYYAHGSRGEKFALEAVPALLDYFLQMGDSIPFSYFTESNLDGESLLARIKRAQDYGITAPYKAVTDRKYWNAGLLEGSPGGDELDCVTVDAPLKASGPALK